MTNTPIDIINKSIYDMCKNMITSGALYIVQFQSKVVLLISNIRGFSVKLKT